MCQRKKYKMAFHVATVYILNLPSHVDRPYDYYIPNCSEQKIKKGDIVTVPFGGGNKHVTALVSEIKEKEDTSGLKPVVSSALASLSDEELELCFFLSERTFCSIGDAVKTIIPSTVISKSHDIYRVTDKQIYENCVNIKAITVYHFIRMNEPASMSMLIQEFGDDVRAVVDTLVSLGYAYIPSDGEGSKKIKNESLYSLPYPPHEAEKRFYSSGLRSGNILAILNYIAEHGTSSSEILRREISATSQRLKSLEIRGLVCKETKEVYRNPYAGDNRTCKQKDPPLTPSQQESYDKAVSLLYSGKPEAALLHGVTGSGKTLVIKKLIDKVLSQGKQVILLVPEIALTPQTVGYFISFYGKRVAVFHSSLSSGEKYDAWRRMKNNDADLCIGTRSAVFAPFSRLGMIVIDEEHEHTYKSDQSPKYSAIDIARFRAAFHGAFMLLSSATPSLERYSDAKSGVYHRIEMTERGAGAELPQEIISELRADTSGGNTSPVGAVLKKMISDNLDNSEQSILFINRRGYNNFLNCPMCGFVPTCPHCSVSLTHHIRQKKSVLVCHYCGFEEDIPRKCPECASDSFSFVGFGTQFAEQTINSEFPKARVMRMDADTTQQKFSYDRMLSDFKNGKADILLGTQMVTKGHDFPNVTLVGVLLADTSLYLDDYRANERTFQLITQVVGRAGRQKKRGTAVIQTYNPEHPVLLLAAAQDYKTFYENEIAARKALVFPPFCDIALITVSSADEIILQKAVYDTDSALRKLLSGEFSDVKIILFGPFEAPVYKVKETYRMRFVIKCKSNKRLRFMIKTASDSVMRKYKKNISISVDINPNTL